MLACHKNKWYDFEKNLSGFCFLKGDRYFWTNKTFLVPLKNSDKFTSLILLRTNRTPRFSSKNEQRLSTKLTLTVKVSKNRNDLMKHRFSQKPTKLFSGFLPYGTADRNPDNILLVLWEKRCLHKIILVCTDLKYIN